MFQGSSFILSFCIPFLQGQSLGWKKKMAEAVTDAAPPPPASSPIGAVLQATEISPAIRGSAPISTVCTSHRTGSGVRMGALQVLGAFGPLPDAHKVLPRTWCPKGQSGLRQPQHPGRGARGGQPDLPSGHSAGLGFPGPGWPAAARRPRAPDARRACAAHTRPRAAPGAAAASPAPEAVGSPLAGPAPPRLGPGRSRPPVPRDAPRGPSGGGRGGPENRRGRRAARVRALGERGTGARAAAPRAQGPGARGAAGSSRRPDALR